MDWFGLLCLFLFSLVFILGITYVTTADTMGHEVAQRTTQYNLVVLLLLIPLSFLGYFSGKYGLIGFQIFFAVTFIVWLLNWYSRKKKTGILLLDMGRNEDLWVTQVMLGLAYAAFVVYNAWSFFRQVPSGNLQHDTFVTKVSDLFFYLTLSVFWIFQGFSTTEFRTNGICTCLRFISWRRMNSYYWEPSKPNILTIRYKPRFPLFSTWMSWPIPAPYQEAVNHILNERLPERRQLH